MAFEFSNGAERTQNNGRLSRWLASCELTDRLWITGEVYEPLYSQNKYEITAA